LPHSGVIHADEKLPQGIDLVCGQFELRHLSFATGELIRKLRLVQTGSNISEVWAKETAEAIHLMAGLTVVLQPHPPTSQFGAFETAGRGGIGVNQISLANETKRQNAKQPTLRSGANRLRPKAFRGFRVLLRFLHEGESLTGFLGYLSHPMATDSTDNCNHLTQGQRVLWHPQSNDALANMRQAIFCSVLPLCVGGLILLAWIQTEWQWLVLAGIVWLGLGVLLFFAGLFFLFRYSASAWKAKQDGRIRIMGNTLLVALVLLSQFPAALFCMATAESFHSRVLVVVVNDSKIPLQEVKLSYRTGEASLAPIPPGQSAERRLRDLGEGQLVLLAQFGAERIDVELDGYTIPTRQDIHVTIHPNGTSSIVRNFSNKDIFD